MSKLVNEFNLTQYLETAESYVNGAPFNLLGLKTASWDLGRSLAVSLVMIDSKFADDTIVGRDNIHLYYSNGKVINDFPEFFSVLFNAIVKDEYA